jgi:hypothetical protein
MIWLPWLFEFVWTRYRWAVTSQEARRAMLRRNGYNVVGGRVEEAVPPWMVKDNVRRG